MKKTTAVSIEGDRALTRALNRYAEDNNTTVGKLVADAVNEKYGHALAPLLSFFRQRDKSNTQMAGEPEPEAEHA